MPNVRGTLSMARAAEENSANSQFFIVFYPRFSLDKRYTNLGRVIGNIGAVDAINRGEPPAEPTRILQASIASDNRSEEHTSELQSLMRISYAVFCLKKKTILDTHYN